MFSFFYVQLQEGINLVRRDNFVPSMGELRGDEGHNFSTLPV